MIPSRFDEEEFMFIVWLAVLCPADFHIDVFPSQGQINVYYHPEHSLEWGLRNPIIGIS